MSEEAEPNSGSAEAQKQGSKMTKEKGKGRYAAAELRQAVWTVVGVLILLVGVTALILWLVYRPEKPRFTVVNAAVYDLNITSPPIISTAMHFTIITRNPNHRVSIYYDRLLVFVSYRNQRITPPTVLPPLFHERHSTVAVSAKLGGTAVPVSMEVVNGLVMDEEYGVVGMRLVLLGNIRWKAGPFKTRHYRIYVKCDILVGLKNGYVGQVPLLQSPDCRVDI
ncbi:NDR1/HIN1-like protein 1 [Macadamia integrifolia]|uniref:NDR1/HIN1-like protein 1 n=1 Tax=Macadamia integrifolia TaxID=60698 RepID=UPI001C52BC47|nr:NDR1/HIN1-like protein 1 [Macadamia integrifolia]